MPDHSLRVAVRDPLLQLTDEMLGCTLYPEGFPVLSVGSSARTRTSSHADLSRFSSTTMSLPVASMQSRSRRPTFSISRRRSISRSSSLRMSGTWAIHVSSSFSRCWSASTLSATRLIFPLMISHGLISVARPYTSREIEFYPHC